jgi:hypothetical protein
VIWRFPPLGSMIDKAIMQNASGAARLEVSIYNSVRDAVKRPSTFMKRPETLMVRRQAPTI